MIKANNIVSFYNKAAAVTYNSVMPPVVNGIIGGIVGSCWAINLFKGINSGIAMAFTGCYGFIGGAATGALNGLKYSTISLATDYFTDSENSINKLYVNLGVDAGIGITALSLSAGLQISGVIFAGLAVMDCVNYSMENAIEMINDSLETQSELTNDVL